MKCRTCKIGNLYDLPNGMKRCEECGQRWTASRLAEIGQADIRELAERAFGELHESAPIEAPAWNDLHQVEREHLVRFAEILVREARA